MLTLQSGRVIPNNLAIWVLDGIIQDMNVQFNTHGVLVSTVNNVNFNHANFDNPIPINLPLGSLFYRITKLIISGASTVLTSATFGLFTQKNGLGFPIFNAGTAITVNQIANDTNNNMQAFTTPNNQDLQWYIDPTLYLRFQTPQGAPALANVSIFYDPLPSTTIAIQGGGGGGVPSDPIPIIF